jgi:N6-adenosine-specific RNA methylase IME4
MSKTKLPFNVVDVSPISGSFIEDSNGTLIARTSGSELSLDEARSVAEFMVRAANNHDAPVRAKDVLAVIHSPRRAHSQKPDEQYTKIERLYPNMSYLEMFARQQGRAGWEYWGNQVKSDISMYNS